MAYVRAASHAGSWYDDDGAALGAELEAWLADAAAAAHAPPHAPAPAPGATLRGVIGPHAGFRFSGPTAAHAYVHLAAAVADPAVRRVFVLGPSHHFHLDGAALSSAAAFATPVGDLDADADAVAALRATGAFSVLTRAQDEAEHSIELHLPYVAHVLARRPPAAPRVRIVAVVVGATSAAREAALGAVLAPFLGDASCVFVVSTDFCHFGARFRYTPFATPPAAPPIWRRIEAMDRDGMAAIESGDPTRFAAYLAETRNTICGRHPVGVVLAALRVLDDGGAAAAPQRPCRHVVRFVAYEQSSHVVAPTDSSVSYASAGVWRT